MDPIEHIQPKKDTTLGMLYAAQQRGWGLCYFEYASLSLNNGDAVATAQTLTVSLDEKHWFDLGDRQTLPLNSQAAILMRKDPPVDIEYLYACRILEFVQHKQCLVVNNPRGIITANEKILAQEFPEFSVPTVVSKQPEHLHEFLKQQKDAVIKPLDNMGGNSVFRVKYGDKSARHTIDTMCLKGQTTVMMQRLIPEYTLGDKRVLLIDGEPIPFALNRIPQKGELRANLAAGGYGEVVEISETDRKICSRVAPRLQELGILFAGLDIIGNKLTEINITSPTCAREISNKTGYDVCGKLIDALENKIRQ